MAQVNLDVVYNVKGLSALKQADQQMLKAGKAANVGANNIKKFNRATAGTGVSATVGAKGIKKFSGALKGLASLAGITTLLAAFGATAQQISKVDFSKAKLRTLGVDAEVLAKKLKVVSAELGYQQSEAELLGAAYDVASAGFTNAADAAAVLKASAMGATGGFAELAEVADATTSVLNAYGLSASKAEQIVDGFITTQNDGKIVVAQYAAQIGKIAPIAAAAGVGIDELNAAISASTASGVPVESAFAGMRQAIAAVLKPTSEAAAYAKELGIEFNAAAIQSKGFGGVLDDVNKATGGSAEAMTKLFGSVEAVAAVAPVLANDMEKFNSALENQRNSAGAAAKAQAEAAATMKGAWTATINAVKNLITALLPAFTPLAKLLGGLAMTIGFLATNIKKVIQILATVGTFVVVLKGAAVATKLWATATQILGTGLKGVAAAQATINALTGVGLPTIVAAAGAAAVTYGALELAMKDAAGEQSDYNEQAKELEGILDGLGVAGDKLAEALAAIGNEPQAAGPGLTDTEEKIDRLRKKADKLKFSMENALKVDKASTDQALRVTQSRLDAEKSLNDVKLEQANRDMDAAQFANEKVRAAQQIYDLTVANAAIQLKSSTAAAQAELQKVEAQERYLSTAVRVQQVKLLEAKAAGAVTEAHYQAVDAARQALSIAQDEVTAQREVTQNVIGSAKATYDMAVAGARAKLEMQQTAAVAGEAEQKVGGAANEAGRLASNLQAAASAASGINAGGGGGGGGGGGSTVGDYSHRIYDKYKVVDGKVVETSEAERQSQMASAAAQKLNDQHRRAQAWDQGFAGTNYNARTGAVNQRGGTIGVAGSQMFNAFLSDPSTPTSIRDFLLSQQQSLNPRAYGFAEGGYVTGPTQAVVGEGGEPEYIIPQSKMDSAMQRYGSGMRGSSVIPDNANVSINYSGSTVDMGGTSYINKGDVNGIVSQAVNATLTTLKKSPKARLEAGMR